jgi:hypothetical protein
MSIWGELANELEIYPVPSEHVSIPRAYVADLGMLLSRCLAVAAKSLPAADDA